LFLFYSITGYINSHHHIYFKIPLAQVLGEITRFLHKSFVDQ